MTADGRASHPLFQGQSLGWRIAEGQYEGQIGLVLADCGVGLAPSTAPADLQPFILGLTGSVVPLDAVLASPCVDHCDADPALLSASILADLVIGARVADWLDVPMISICGTGEEVHLVPSGLAERASWERVSQVMAAKAQQLAPTRGAHVLSTGDPDVWACVNDQVDADRALLTDDRLEGLYRLTDGSRFPAGSRFDFYYAYYRSNVAHYRLPLLQSLTGLNINRLLVVENAQQTKAIQLARELNPVDSTSQLVTVPAPGPDSRQRATRAGQPLLGTGWPDDDWPKLDGLSDRYWALITAMVAAHPGFRT